MNTSDTILKFEQQLENEATLITEAITDVVTIARLNEGDVTEQIRKQFLIISREDLQPQSNPTAVKLNVEQCKDKIAEEWGYGDWADLTGSILSSWSGHGKKMAELFKAENEAMRLYALQSN